MLRNIDSYQEILLKITKYKPTEKFCIHSLPLLCMHSVDHVSMPGLEQGTQQGLQHYWLLLLKYLCKVSFFRFLFNLLLTEEAHFISPVVSQSQFAIEEYHFRHTVLLRNYLSNHCCLVLAVLLKIMGAAIYCELKKHYSKPDCSGSR